MRTLLIAICYSAIPFSFSSVAQANSIVFESCPGDFVTPFRSHGENDYYELYSDSENGWMCHDRDALVQALNGTAAILGTISATCGVFPEPAVTKIAVPIFGIPGAVVGTLAWLVSGVDCYRPLSEDEKFQVRTEACYALGMLLDEVTHECIDV